MTFPLILRNSRFLETNAKGYWEFLRDQISMSVSQTRTLYQKVVLSRQNGIYDPLGLIGAFVIKDKILMRQLWTNCEK